MKILSIVFILLNLFSGCSKRNKSPFKRIPLNSEIFYKTLGLFVENVSHVQSGLVQQGNTSDIVVESKPLWVITLSQSENKDHGLELPTFYPEAVLSLLLQLRVTFDDVLSISSSSKCDYTIRYGQFEKEPSAIKSDKLINLLSKHNLKVSLSLKSKIDEVKAKEKPPGSIGYKRLQSAPIQFNRCEGRVSAYAGAFLVPLHVFLASDYGIEVKSVRKGETNTSAYEILDVQKLRSLEAASFRTFNAADKEAKEAERLFTKKEKSSTSLNSIGGQVLKSTTSDTASASSVARGFPHHFNVIHHQATFLKTSDVSDFYVNHFSGWAHWHFSHQFKEKKKPSNSVQNLFSASINMKQKGMVSDKITSSSGGDGGSSSDARDVQTSHEMLTVQLSQMMENECSVLNNIYVKSTSPGESSTPLLNSLALIPFWAGSLAESGGNAHYEAPSMETKLQQVSGSICSSLKYFNRVVVGVCGKDADLLQNWFRTRWTTIQIFRINPSLSNYDSSSKSSNQEEGSSANYMPSSSSSSRLPKLLLLECRCSVGVQLPFLLLTTVQTLMKESLPLFNSDHQSQHSLDFDSSIRNSFFKSADLIYYTEADQITSFKSFDVLHTIGKALLVVEAEHKGKSGVKKKQQQVVVSSSSPESSHQTSSFVVTPQRVAMRFTQCCSRIVIEGDGKDSSEDQKERIATYIAKNSYLKLDDDEIYHNSLSQITDKLLDQYAQKQQDVSTKVTITTLSATTQPSSSLLTLTNACTKCPHTLCRSSLLPDKVSTKLPDTFFEAISLDPMKLLLAKQQNDRFHVYIYERDRVDFSTKEEAQRYWLISHGFNSRDNGQRWPSAQPTHSPTHIPTPMPSTISPTHLPTTITTPMPTLSPAPTHPIIWFGRLLLVMVFLLVVIAKFKLTYAGKIHRSASY